MPELTPNPYEAPRSSLGKVESNNQVNLVAAGQIGVYKLSSHPEELPSFNNVHAYITNKASNRINLEIGEIEIDEVIVDFAKRHAKVFYSFIKGNSESASERLRNTTCFVLSIPLIDFSNLVPEVNLNPSFGNQVANLLRWVKSK